MAFCFLVGTCTADLILPDKPLGSALHLEDAGDQLAPARAAFDRGDIPACRERLGTITAGSAVLPHPDIQLALWYFNAGRDRDAARTMEMLAETESNRADVRYLFAELARGEGRYFDAWTHLVAAGQVEARGRWSPQYVEHLATLLLETRARTADARSDWVRSGALFGQLNKTKRASVECDMGLGRAAFHLARVEEAEAHFRAAALRSEEVIPELVLARLASSQGDLPGAEKWFRQGLEGPPSERSENVRLEYLRWLLRQNRAVDAQRAAEAHTPTEKQVRSFQYMLALAHRMQGALIAAESVLMPLHRKEEANFQVSNQLALVLVESLDKKKRERAFALASRNAKALPDAREALSTYGWIVHRAGDSAQAEQVFNRILQGGEVSRDTAYYVSRVKAALGKSREATAYLEAARTSSGEFFNLPGLDESSPE
jgi:tetratricopeptide (TPR) repeat protein